VSKIVTIAGGGLAGLSLGIALRSRGVGVRVLEAGSYPRHRVCGEFISGVSDEELAGLGIGDLLADAPRHRSTAWFDAEAELLREELPDAARGLSRYCLDQRLAERLVALGGELRTGVRFDAKMAGPMEGQVLAMGRVRRPSNWLGLKAHYLDLPLSAALEVHLAGSCYVGMTPVEGGRVNVCGLFHRAGVLGAGERGMRLPMALREAGLYEVAERLRGARVDVESVVGVNQFLLGWQPRPGVDELRLGDGAAMIPPFTGNGMSMAFQSALDAVEPLVRWNEGEWPWRVAVAEIGKRHRSRFRRRLRWSWLLQAVLMSPGARDVGLGMVRQGWLPFRAVYGRVR